MHPVGGEVETLERAAALRRRLLRLAFAAGPLGALIWVRWFAPALARETGGLPFWAAPGVAYFPVVPPLVMLLRLRKIRRALRVAGREERQRPGAITPRVRRDRHHFGRFRGRRPGSPC